MPDSRYLGDGVYASFDGYQIWLQAGSHQIALEPAVFVALLKYRDYLAGDKSNESGKAN